MKRSPMKRRGKRTKKSKGHLFPKLVDETYRAWIRSRACHFRTLDCWGDTEVCHVKSRGAGGADHGNLLPMCAVHHSKQHQMGIISFQKVMGADLKELAGQYYRWYERDYLTPFEGL